MGPNDVITCIEIRETIVLLANHLFLRISYIYRRTTFIATFYGQRLVEITHIYILCMKDEYIIL
jgi:hypothetical protein